MSDCTCWAPEDAELEDHDQDCPEYSGDDDTDLDEDDQ